MREPTLGRSGHRHRIVELCLTYVIGDQCKQSAMPVLFELALDEVRTSASSGGDIGDAHAFWWGSGVVGCWCGAPVALGGVVFLG